MNIHIKQTKFHKVCFKKYYIEKLNKEELTLRTLLCYYQDIASNKYYNESLQTNVLGMHYDARFTVNLKQIGVYNIIEYSLTSVDPIYINDPNYTIEGLEKLFNELLIPRFWNKKAVKKLFQIAKEIYKSDLLSRFENLQVLAFENTIKNFYKDTIRDLDTYGSLELLEQITTKDLYDYYQKVMTEQTISISSGNFEKVNDDSFSITPKVDFQFRFRGNHPQIMYEKFNTEQCYLHVIYDVHTYSNDKYGMAMRAINYLFGGKTSSYLFNIVREKYGLCYSINSMYLGASGIIVVSTIIDYCNLSKVIELIDQSLNEIIHLDWDLEEIKKYFRLNNDTQKDNFNSKIENYLMDNYFSLDDKSFNEINKINNLTKEDIVEAFKLIEKSFIYVFGGENHD